MNEIESGKRIAWLDLARSFAIATVVLCHATEGIYSLNLNYMSTISLQSKIFAFTSFTIGRLGVPIFLFLSGYLLLDRRYDNTQCHTFWRRKFLPLLITVEIWIIFYTLFLSWRGAEISATDLILQLLFLKNVSLGHMWYIPMILGLYILVPFVANALQSLDCKKLYFPAATVFMYGLAVPTINVLSQAAGKSSISAVLSLGFSGGVYGLYIVLGYMVKKGCFQKVSAKLLAGVSCVSFIAIVAMQMLCYSKAVQYNVWYTNGLLMICTLCIFELFSRLNQLHIYIYIYILAQKLSVLSFGIYLIHLPIQRLIIPYVKLIDVLLPVKVAIVFAVTFTLSFLSILLISKIPRVGKILLNL